MNYQEQIEHQRKLKSQRQQAENSMDRFCQILADGLLPLINDGTITQDQAAKIMVSIVKNVGKSV